MDDNIIFASVMKQVDKAFNSGNVPVGAVIVRNGRIISKAYNKKNSSNISLYHAEILAIIRACRKLRTWILDDCVLYVSLEPCDMCKNAIAESRIREVKYLLNSNYNTNFEKNFNSINIVKCNNNIYLDKYKTILSSFFKNIRK